MNCADNERAWLATASTSACSTLLDCPMPGTPSGRSGAVSVGLEPGWHRCAQGLARLVRVRAYRCAERRKTEVTATRSHAAESGRACVPRRRPAGREFITALPRGKEDVLAYSGWAGAAKTTLSIEGVRAAARDAGSLRAIRTPGLWRSRCRSCRRHALDHGGGPHDSPGDRCVPYEVSPGDALGLAHPPAPLDSDLAILLSHPDWRQGWRPPAECMLSRPGARLPDPRAPAAVLRS